MDLRIRKIVTFREAVLEEGGRKADQPLVKAAVACIFKNPYAGGPYQEDLSELIEIGKEIGEIAGKQAAETLGAGAVSYGKAVIVGVNGEIEHAVATKTSVFGNAFREAIGGGEAWISSVSKRSSAGVQVDVPLAYKDEIWVRSHYDAITVNLTDAPLPDEIVTIAAVASRGRLNARVGGMTVEEARAQAAR